MLGAHRLSRVITRARPKRLIIANSQSISARLQSKQLLDVAITSAASGAVLGPLLDGMHSKNNVLHYVDPIRIQLGSWELETCWWVPPLFGLAGIIIGLGVPVLDRLLGDEQTIEHPPQWPAVLACISLFVAQYGLSGVMDKTLHAFDEGAVASGLGGMQWVESAYAVCGPYTQDAVLVTYALAHFLLFDRTRAGFLLAALTAVCGPAIEIALINGPHLYSYSHPQVLGIPIWIAWVYFAGGPAVGNLGRRIWADLEAKS